MVGSAILREVELLVSLTEFERAPLKCTLSWYMRLAPIILATQEAEIRRIKF
jgi:hypothetical protein